MIDNKYSQIALNKPFSVQAVQAFSLDKSLGTEPNSNNPDVSQS
jgi:hypothetical protein